VINVPSNPTAAVYVPEFHTLCQYLWYTHLKLSMQHLLISVNPFQPIYRPRTESNDIEIDTRQRETQLLTMARYALELLAFADLHNKATLQGSLLTTIGLMRDPKGVAEIIRGIDETDVVIALRRRLGLLKDRIK
jgi:hypothetical protein